MRRGQIPGELRRVPAGLNEQTQSRRDRIISQMPAAEGITEDLKRKDSPARVGAMNNIRAEEIVLHELIYI